MEIIATGTAFPKRRVTNDDLTKIMDTSDEWIRTRTGIASRNYCEEETCASLAIEAAKKAVKEAGIDKNDIGAVVVATTTADYLFPSTACLIQQGLELPEEVMVFDLNAGCTGFLMGLGVANGLLATIRQKYVLLVGSEQLSKILDFDDRGTCILFGDGAGAAILGRSEGRFYQRSWAKGDSVVLHCPSVGNKPKCEKTSLFMKGNEVFRFAVKVLEDGICKVMDDLAITMEDVDYVICHQANGRIIDHVRKKFKGFENKFFINIENHGNTSAASIPVAIHEMQQQGKLPKGSRVIFVGFGAGLSWSSAYMEV